MRRTFPVAWLYPVLVFLFLFALPAAARGRVIREPSMLTYVRRVPNRRFRTDAERQGRRDWPSPPERPGTRLQVVLHPGTASVAIVAPHAYGEERLLALTEALVRRLDLPADIHAYAGRTTTATEMDFSGALRRVRLRLDGEIPVGRIAAALQASDLPRPTVVGIAWWNGDRATLGSGPTAHSLGQQTWFCSLKDVRPGDVLHFEATASWKGLPFVAILLGGFLVSIATPWFLAFRKPKEAPAPVDPDEVQRRYDRQPAGWVLVILLILATVALLTLFGMSAEKGLRALDILLPFPFRSLIRGFAILLPASWIACWLVMRGRRPVPEAQIDAGEEGWPEENPGATAARGLVLMMLPMLLMLPLLYVLAPLILRVVANHPEWRGALRAGGYHGGLYSMYASMGLGLWLSARANRKALRAGRWHAMVHELADMAGVRVKKVVLLRAKAPNAFAGILGTVGLTQGLVQQMEPDEVRAVIAHELGHLKRGHTRRTLAVFLSTVALLWLGLRWAGPILERHIPNSPLGLAMYLFPVMLVITVVPTLIVGPGQRKREREADALAVEWTGDPELVIRALTKLHHLAESPGRLKPSDETLSTHPSLVHRIEAIRARAGAAGAGLR